MISNYYCNIILRFRCQIRNTFTHHKGNHFTSLSPSCQTSCFAISPFTTFYLSILFPLMSFYSQRCAKSCLHVSFNPIQKLNNARLRENKHTALHALQAECDEMQMSKKIFAWIFAFGGGEENFRLFRLGWEGLKGKIISH